MGVAALLGTGAAIAAAGDRAQTSANVPITIQGVSFKEGRGNTITINGVPFKRRGGTITINGTAFKGSARGQTLTINGTSFRTGTLPRTLTINGNSFRSSGRTLTINGTTFEPGSATKPGPTGPQGPPGPVLSGAPPKENGGPVAVKAGAGRLELASPAGFEASVVRRVLVTGGFTATCVGCRGPVNGTWELRRDGTTVARRSIGTLTGDETAGVTLSELIVTSGACGPCEFRLVAFVPADATGAPPEQLDITDVRLGVVDLGTVSG